MSKLAQLRQAQTLTDLAKLVGFAPKSLSFILYKLPEEKKYRTFPVPKKGGGTRTIKAPEPQLSLLQKRLAELLEACVQELVIENPRYLVASHGFRKGRTIVSNANTHRKRRYVFNADIADFFGSINFGRVRGVFLKDRAFELSPAVATVIAQIACHENSLPQGSPCSPIISNLVGNILDARLLRLAKNAHCTYSRYADDLTFSTNEKLFPKEIALELAGAEWKPGKRFSRVIKDAGFSLNPAKTRMSLRRSRQTVTGLVVNQKPNIRQDYYRSVRHMCDSVFRTGFWYRPIGIPPEPPKMLDILRPLEGMLSHVYYVKTRKDRTFAYNKRIGFAPPRAPIVLYRNFLFYKHFVANRLPIIVTEGISDVTFLKCAIKSRASHFKSLVSIKSGKLTPQISFLNPTGTSRSILDLGNGTSGQQKLIVQYENRLKKYRHQPLTQPVIILCDNDQGADTIFKAAKNKAKKDVSLTTTDSFYHLGHNLYLVKVPEEKPAISRDIEDLFFAAALKETVDGKSFDKKKEHGDHASYGKVVFAERVVKPKIDSINFSGFDELLQRLTDCIIDYAAKSTVKTVVFNPSTAVVIKS